jgi:hypothetical protein
MKNNYRVDGETVTIEVLSKGELFEVLIDLEDFKTFSELGVSVCLHSGRYASFKKFGKVNLLHRWLMEFPDGDVDHLNGSKLDNRRKNLRVCSRSENNMNKNNKYKNKTGEKHIYSRNNKFFVRMTLEGKVKEFYGFDTVEHAVKYRDKLLGVREELIRT